MTERAATLEVAVDAAGADDEELDGLPARLRRELLQLDVDAVDRPAGGSAPAGSKGLDLVLVGTLLVQVGRTAGKLASVVGAVQGWLRSHGDRSVKLSLDGESIELTGASTDAQQQLVELWIRRHSEPP